MRIISPPHQLPVSTSTTVALGTHLDGTLLPVWPDGRIFRLFRPFGRFETLILRPVYFLLPYRLFPLLFLVSDDFVILILFLPLFRSGIDVIEINTIFSTANSKQAKLTTRLISIHRDISPSHPSLAPHDA